MHLYFVDYNADFLYYEYMFDSFLSQMLVIFLLFICCVRIFFTKNSKIDSAAVLAPLAFVISIFNIFLWNVNCTNIFLLFLSLFVFLSNIRALFRLSARVFVDRYSAAFVIFTIIELLLVVFLGIFTFINRPVKLEPQKFNVKKQKTILNDDFTQNFNIHSKLNFFNLYPRIIYTYNSEENKTGKELPLVLFCGTNIAEVQDYEPYFLLLASKGCTILAADFYGTQQAEGSALYNSKFLRKFFSAQNKTQEIDKEKSYIELTRIAQKIYGYEQKFFFVFDATDFEAINKITENAVFQNGGFFCLNSIPEFKTSSLGFIEQTNIPLARKLGFDRDSSLFIPRYLAGKTFEEIENANFIAN